jgi:hypothetical protein
MPGIRVSMLLADAAQTVNGKLYILGGGWSIIGPNPQPFAIAMDIKTPWDRGDVTHPFRLELLDADGNSVEVPTPEGMKPLFIEGEFTAEQNPDLKPGTPLDGVIALAVSALPLKPGGRFEWRLWIDGETDEDWVLPFSTRPAAAEEEEAA